MKNHPPRHHEFNNAPSSLIACILIACIPRRVSGQPNQPASSVRGKEVKVVALVRNRLDGWMDRTEHLLTLVLFFPPAASPFLLLLLLLLSRLLLVLLLLLLLPMWCAKKKTTKR